MKQITIALMCIVMLCGCGEDRKQISAFESYILIEDCKAKGGVTKPIYDKDDPTKVYGMPCYANGEVKADAR